jgi:CTP:molybdopterin cytidylyltransferase MocA
LPRELRRFLMKAYVTHERDGEIVSFILGPADGPPIAIAPEPGQYLAEVDAPRRLVQLFRDGEADEEKVIKELSAYRLDVKTEAKLVRRRQSGKK